MSSNEDDYNEPDNPSSVLQGLKKRRIQRACDICRRKKIRCDGVQMPGNRCSNCIAYSFECSYVEAAKKRGPPKGYVESLENRLEKLEKLLRRLCPDDNLLRDLDSTIDKGSWVTDPSSNSQASTSVFTNGRATSPTHLTPTNPRDIATSAIRRLHAPAGPPDEFQDDDNAHLILADNLKRLSIDPVDYRFFGKSSGAMLIQTAIELKNEYTGSDNDLRRAVSVLGSKRVEFWSPHPWERNTSTHKHANYTFPEPDLIPTLTDLYFENANLYLPLLHRPTFERSVAEGYHLNNDSFAATLLLVCAVGSRFSDDPRVLLDDEESLHSAGWKWFEQVQMVRKSLLAPPSLYDLQFYCLSVQFLQGSSAPQSCWTMVGIGIRLAQDVGAHRRKAQKGPLSIEDELWKRAFWVLVCMDRMVSAALGRPCAIQDEDFDLELPVECDDEYWEHPDPEQRWKQPPGKPSLMSSFNLYLKLNQILAFSLRTIYSINKSKILLGFVGQQWEQHIVAELDSALNKWVDSVPDHLRWDPNREDRKFFNQSVVLYAAYYHIQVLIHRPFIPSPSKPSPLSFPSLAICTNAARSCSHVVDVQLRRNPQPPPLVQMAVFTSGIVLLLSIWGGKRSGLSTDPVKEMVDVHKCMRVLRTCEKRWHSAGRLWDILYELASVGDLPLPQASPPSSNKRERDSEAPMSSPDSNPIPALPPNDGPRPIAGSRRVQKELSMPTVVSPPSTSGPSTPSQTLSRSAPLIPKQEPQPMQPLSSPQVPSQLNAQPSSENLRSAPSLPHQPHQQQHQYFSLPVYSEELARLPLHGQIEFSQTSHPALGPSGYWYDGARGSSNSSSMPMHSVNVNVNVNVTGRSGDPISPMAGIRSSHLQCSSESPAAGFTGSNAMSIVSPSSGYGLEDGAPSPMYNQLEALTYPAGKHASASYSASGMASSSGSMGQMFGASPSTIGSGGMRERRPSQAQQQQSPGHFAQLQQPSPHPYQLAQQQLQQEARYGPMPPPTPQSQQLQPQGYVDSDTMAMWSNAPTGFELDEWGTYLMSVSELTHAQPPPQNHNGPGNIPPYLQHGHP